MTIEEIQQVIEELKRIVETHRHTGLDSLTVDSTTIDYNLLLNRPASTVLATATDGATVTFNLSLSNKQIVTLGGNRTLALSNLTIGAPFIIGLTQDSTGSRTVTWFSGITWAFGNVVPSLTTTANKTDWFGFIPVSAGLYHGFVIGQNV